MLKKLWHDPVWSKVIAAGILTGAAWLSYRLDWWPALRRGIEVAWVFLLASSPVRHWVFGLLVLAALFAVLLGIVVISSLMPSNSNQGQLVSLGPDWHSYQSDSFFGLRWRWRYDGGRIQQLLPFVHTATIKYFPTTHRHSLPVSLFTVTVVGATSA